MPVGVPKAPFRIPGDEDATWVDLYNRLYRTRVAFLGQEIDYEIGNHIIGLMVFYNIEDKNKDVFFFITSPGGLAIPGFGIFDIMQYIGPDVYTLGIGLVASMASLLLAGGEKSKRLGGDNMRVMMHQPASVIKTRKKPERKPKKNKPKSKRRGKGEPFKITFMDGKHITIIREEVINAYVQITGKDWAIINDDLERNLFMTATEAKDYGLIDDIGLEGISSIIRESNKLEKGKRLSDSYASALRQEAKNKKMREESNPEESNPSDSSDSDEPD